MSDESPLGIDISTLDELGSTGLTRFGGFVFDEFLRELQGPRGMKVYREMADNDPTINAAMLAVDLLVRGTDWRVDPAGDDQQSHADADFLDGCMDDMSATWSDTVSEILTMIPFGWAWHEQVFKHRLGPNPGMDKDGKPLPASKFDDGLLGWRRLPGRAQETLWMWKFGDNGSIEALIQRAAPDFAERHVPMAKSLLFRHRAHKNNPEGRSAARGAYRPWYFKEKLEVIEGIGIERDLAGLPVIYVPPELLDPKAGPDVAQQRASLEKIVRNIRNDEQGGLLMPSKFDASGHRMYELVLLSTGGRRAIDPNISITRYNQQIAQVFLADMVLIGNQGRGSYALMESKVELFTAAVVGWLDSICEVFNRHAVPKLFTVNGMQRDKYPQIAHGQVNMPDLKDLAAYVTALAGGQPLITPTPADEQYLREVADMPMTPEQTDAMALGKEWADALIKVGRGRRRTSIRRTP